MLEGTWEEERKRREEVEDWQGQTKTPECPQWAKGVNHRGEKKELQKYSDNAVGAIEKANGGAWHGKPSCEFQALSWGVIPWI